MHSRRTLLKRYNPDCNNLLSYPNQFLVARYTTLHLTMSVWEIEWQLGDTSYDVSQWKEHLLSHNNERNAKIGAALRANPALALVLKPCPSPHTGRPARPYSQAKWKWVVCLYSLASPLREIEKNLSANFCVSSFACFCMLMLSEINEIWFMFFL